MKGNTMNKEKIALDDWVSTYLEVFATDEALQERIDSHGGFAGWVSEGVSALDNVDGEEATDHECLEHAYELLGLYFDAVERGVDTQ
jgi:hypothetical protein